MLVAVLTTERGLHLLLKSHLPVVSISELLLTLYILQRSHSFSAEHDALGSDNLPQSPLKKLTNRDNVQDSYRIESTIAWRTRGDSNKQASNKKKYENKRYVEAEPPHHHLIGHSTLGGRVEGV